MLTKINVNVLYSQNLQPPPPNFSNRGEGGGERQARRSWIRLWVVLHNIYICLQM